MGIINQGILGGFSGKVGTVIGGTWKGIDYMRGISPVTNPQTLPQLTQRLKFSIIMSFLQPLTGFLKIGFKNFAVKMTGINAAMGFNLRNAISGVYPNFTIDYPSALISRGNLAPSLNQAVASTVAGTVNFTWENNSGEIGASASDKTLLVVYNPAKHQVVATNQLTERSAAAQAVTVPDSFTGDNVHCYMAFIQAEGSEVSNSRYAGAVVVA